MRNDPSSISCPLPGLDPKGYARWRGSTLGAITERLEQDLVLELVGDVTGKRVLEIGCGDGTLAVELARRGARMTAIDASEAMITAAKQRAGASSVTIEFGVAAAQSLPFAAGQFDLVVAFTILCFIDAVAPVFGEIARVLRPGGRLVIGELNRWSPWAAERRVRAWLGSALWRRGRFRSSHQLRQLALDAGLVPGSVVGAVYYPRSALAARWLSPFDRKLRRITTLGPAFLALSAVKPIGDVS